jgi:hypothetical protein
MLAALLGELLNIYVGGTTLLLRQKVFDRHPARGINYQSAGMLLPDRSPLVVVPKNLLFSPVSFCQEAAGDEGLLSFTGQTFSTSFVQLFTWNVFYYDGIERWILGFFLCLCTFSFC